MKTHYCLIAIICFCLPIVIYGQQDHIQKLEFYTELAFKDAQYEQSLYLLSIEDETDFWKDQEAFENTLRENDFWAYNVYISGKHEAYRAYQDACNDSCGYSNAYLRKASYYAVHGSGQPWKEIVYSSEQ